MNTAPDSATASPWADVLPPRAATDNPAWAKTLQEQAAGHFRKHGLPDRKTEAWRYTPMRLIEALDPRAAASDEPPGQSQLPEPLCDANMVVTIADGVLRNVPDCPPGISLLTLAEALATQRKKLQPLLESQELNGRNRSLAALNTAMLSQGLVVLVDANVDAGRLLLRWAFSAEGARLGNFRLFVLLEKGARMELVEQFQSLADSGNGLNLVAQVKLGERTVLDHLRLQRESENSLLLTDTSVQQEGGSRYVYSGFDLGGRLVRHEINVILAGERAETEIRGAFVLDGRRYADHHVNVDHAVGNCRSQQFFRGVLDGSSRGVFNGRALIRKGADGTSVRQSNANLLLSERAEMDTKPELEIYADEVEASHGATVGQLDENAVFYLRSRGLDDSQARRMLTAAFCNAVTDRLENRPIAERITELLDEAMPGSGVAGQ